MILSIRRVIRVERELQKEKNHIGKVRDVSKKGST